MYNINPFLRFVKGFFDFSSIFFKKSHFFMPSSTKKELCEIKSGGGRAEAEGVVKENVQEKFSVLRSGKVSTAFQCKGAEGGEGSEKADEQHRKVFMKVGKTHFAQDETEARCKRSRYVHRQSRPEWIRYHSPERTGRKVTCQSPQNSAGADE